MTVVVRLILRLATDVHKDNDDDIGDEVAERVDGISHHRSTMAKDACHELEDE